ncbi:DUF1700 domain-containing protein [Bacillus paramycoides]|uniref:DUF1700 domain-containing protein n=1 Tax=Bacillus paramycoides TaxID=2026194 RepID=UPI0022438B52|nr:DUF1700 domain-containing protein [Bacillus paramycoides]MCW9134699.1 DUF1700 domain-containing protein [Bacillus paramycoides]
MNKAYFLDSLKQNLKSLSKEERLKFISYYEEIIEDYIEDGYSEKDAVEKVGNPLIIAQDILKEPREKQVKVFSKSGKIFIGFLIILGFPLWGSLLLAGIVLVLSGYFLIWCLPFTTGAFAVAGLVASLISIIGAPFLFKEGLYLVLTQFGIGILVLGLGILSGIITLIIAKQFLKITIRFTQKVFKFFKRTVVYL